MPLISTNVKVFGQEVFFNEATKETIQNIYKVRLFAPICHIQVTFAIFHEWFFTVFTTTFLDTDRANFPAFRS